MPAGGPHLSATKTAVEIPICAGELPGLGSRKDPSPESFGLVSREILGIVHLSNCVCTCLCLQYTI
uniref:Uncharacterized protein n=1 Tax=Terrapene triunguis TaxID=2587831 RepID=A0A674I1V0_9SAUR